MGGPIGATGNGATFFDDDERPRSADHGSNLIRLARPHPTDPSPAAAPGRG